MAEREEKTSSKTAEKTAEKANEEVEESSASEYEEIIEEVTDYSDAEEEAAAEKEEPTKSTSDKSIKKSVSNKSNENLKIVEKSTKEIVEAPKKTDKTECDGKVKATVTQSEKAETIINKKEKGGESLLPFLQDLLHKSRVPAKQQPTTKQIVNQNNKVTTKDITKTISSSKQIQKTNTNKISGGGSVSASISSSSGSTQPSKKSSENKSSCTVLSVSNNKKISGVSSSSASSLPQVTTTTTTTNKDMTNKLTTTPSSGNDTKSERLIVPQREDSGIESGEDLRLIAAGLRDKLQMQNGDSNLIEEVTTALCKLECSLKEGKEIALDGQKRKVLLALVARLQAGLISPEQLDDENSLNQTNDVAENDENNFDEISSHETDAHRTNRHRFAKRRNRNIRHTVGVSREELADARRYMEDMLMMENISNSATPESSVTPAITPPQWFPIEKNSSSSAILCTQPPAQSLYRPNQFVPSNIKSSTECLSVESNPVVLRNGGNKNANSYRRPLSGEYSVSFEQSQRGFASDGAERSSQNVSPDSAAKGNRFNNKRGLMKRANTIDIPKSKKYSPEFDTDSDLEDRGPHLGLKRTVQVSVKQKVRHVVPPFEPKTENDHKFLAFINKQSPKPGLGWTTSRSVSNWTNKFGNIKNTFEVGAAAMATTGKPPQVPGSRKQNVVYQDYGQNALHAANRNQQQRQIQQQQQQQHQESIERQRLRMERDRLERERIEKDRLERQRFERERVERDRLERERLEREKERIEREYFERERERVQRDRLAAAAAAQQQQQQERQRHQRQQPAPVNQFIHAPQSVFKPIENGNPPAHNVYKPIPQMPAKGAPPNTWQPPSSLQNKPTTKSTSIASPQFLGHNKSPYTTSPSSTTTSPIGLPWVSKPAVNNSDFRNKANRFEEASQNDNRQAALAASGSHGLHRHNSLRSTRVSQQHFDDFRKRPSLPNASDPYQALHSQYGASHYDLPPPTNISFRYTDSHPTVNNYKSVPCLPTAVDASMDNYMRSRESSLTNPQAMPLVLTSSNPTYGSHSDNLQNSYIQNTARQFEYAHPSVDSTPTSPATFAHTDYTDDDLDLDSDNNLLEYRVESKVMRKPQSQTAVTVGRRTAHVSDDEVYGKNSRAAKNLLHTMRSLGNEQQSKPNEMAAVKKKPSTPITSPTSPGGLTLDGRAYQAPIVEPLFPEITSFAPNREPLYAGERISKPMSTAPQPHPSKAYKKVQQPKVPQPFEPLPYEQNYVNQSNVYKAAPITEPKVPTSAPASAPYVSETQTAYVVTYPLDDPSDYEEHYQRKQHPTTLPLQRQRNVSENSTSSSVSCSYNNLPSPNTSWTQNPVHPENQETKVTAMTTKNSPRVDATTQQPKTQRLAPPETTVTTKLSKPDIAPKPQTTVPTSYQELTQQYYQLPLPQERAPKLSMRSQTISTTTSEHKQIYQQQQQQKPTMIRQKTVDGSTVSSSITPLQTHNRVLSQQSLVTKQQQQFEKFEQKQQRNQQFTEPRRKSLGHIHDVQDEQRKTGYYESQRTEVTKQEVYKSSAPADTPDIVKSSLPKDETTPILKKFGPPQRHHYIPNAYQTPTQQTSQSRSETKKITTGNTTKVIKREVVQHSSVTTKPSIVETPATPQPQDANSEDMIPRNIVFNNVNAFTSLSRRNLEQEQTVEQPRFNRLSKSDSWNQICQIQQAQRPNASSPKFNTSGSELRRTKSGHSLAVPKMYEAGMNKEEITEKQRTVAAYFSGNKSPNSSEATEVVVSKKSSINRTKTIEKVSANRKSLTSSGTTAMGCNSGLVRSATMPHIGNLSLLDESNVDDAFEQLMLGA